MNKVVNRLKLLLLISGLSLTTYSQSYLGFNTDNYSGLHGVLSNPGNIADSRIKADINLFSLDVLGANDYVSLSLNNINQYVEDSDFVGLNTTPSDQNNVAVNASVLGPSFMFNLNEKHSVGLITRVRMFNTYNNVNGQLIESIIDGFASEDFNFSMHNLDATTHIWSEIGVSYGRVLFDDYDKHYVKGGITLKYLLGAGIAQGYSKSLEGSYNTATDEVSLNGQFDYLISFDEDQDINRFSQNLSPGFGMDLGVVYEYRPRHSISADVDDNPRAINLYKAKIGISLLDFGQITYKSENLTLQRFTMDGTVNADEAEEGFVEALENNFTQQEIPGQVKMALPTSLNLNIDYKVVPLVFVNLNLNQTLVKRNDPYNNNQINQIALIPRFETRLLSAYLPITYSKIGGTSIGAGFKLGPMIVGSSSIISNLLNDKAQMANLYLGFKVPINHRR